MESFVVKGGKKLSGKVQISGAKNAVMPIITACAMVGGEVILHNVPDSIDPLTLLDVMKKLGMKIKQLSPGTWSLSSNGDLKSVVEGAQTEKIRGSQTLLGAILARKGEVTLQALGGCRIGARPIDLHIKGLKALGAEVEMVKGSVFAKVNGRLKGANIFLDFPSVGATENILLAASTAEGQTIIENAAAEPEIEDLAKFLRLCGAKISGDGTKTIQIEGVESLKGTHHSIIPDRIETGTFMIGAVMAGGDVLIEQALPSTVDSLIFKLQEAGVIVRIENHTSIRIRNTSRPKAINIKTLPYPGFPTDLQPQTTAMCSIADGVSVISESVFESRFGAVPELVRMGAEIQAEGHSVIVKGVEKLQGTEVIAPDLRGAVALVLAGLCAEGTTKVVGAHHADRGYEKFEMKLKAIGADIERAAENQTNQHSEEQ